MKKTLYQVLDVEPGATDADIAEAYARCNAALQAGSYDRNAQVIAREAYTILSDPTKRAFYDLSLASGASASRPPVHSVTVEATGERQGWSQGFMIAVALGVGVVIGAFGLWRGNRPQPAPAAQAAAPANPAPVADVEPQPERRTAPPPVVQSTAGDLSDEELFAQLSPGIVRIDVTTPGRQGGSIGSGVVIAAHTVITNCHVAQAGDVLRVRSNAGTYDARLILADEAHDLCKLDVAGLPADPLPVRGSGALRTGQKVVALGAPHGLDLTISEGIVSSLRQVDDGTLIQTTAPISPGSSGGGLFDMRGNLVGIVTFQSTSGQNLNFAAPAEWIGSMTATRGNGIIGKLSAARTAPGGRPGDAASDAAADEAAKLTADFPGRWTCHDSIRGINFHLDIEPNGRLQFHRDNRGVEGRWALVNRRIEVRPDGFDMLQVEYLSAEKMILYVGQGVRHVCGRS